MTTAAVYHYEEGTRFMYFLTLDVRNTSYRQSLKLAPKTARPDIEKNTHGPEINHQEPLNTHCSVEFTQQSDTKKDNP